MMLRYCPLLAFVAAIFLLYFIPASSSTTIAKDDDILSSTKCPAYLLFETAAYLSDVTIELPCQCKPEETKYVVWYYQKKSGDKPMVLTDFKGTVQLDVENVRDAYDTSLKFTIRMFNLIVHKAQIENSGNYLCGTQDGHFFYGYNVDIQDSKDALVSFVEKDGKPQPHLKNKYFVAFTTFSDWTVCDRCDVRGEQRSIGLCYVNSSYLNPRFHANKNDVSSCGSEAVPLKFKKLLSKRRPEILIRSCMTKCHVRKKGVMGMLSTLMHTIGKLKDYIPWISKVPMEIHTQTMGSRMSISCPGVRPEHAVAWDKDNERLYLTENLIGAKKSMRVFIDHGGHLNFRSIQYSDAGTYYCWLQGKLTAGFKLSVQRDPLKKRKFSDPDAIFVMKNILISIPVLIIIFLVVHCAKFFCCCT
ncbi:Ig-like V-type domain-containing protein FAM187A [Hyla sarda]|uniref:Ig-like V-type domain-containing protein FAM187A n=1 Tax=Hyla sarda TaxID=327740 RepID=UPI0024C45DC0|nr:Ig-like V-type domain-containing protein FAM187A [Hyla sarda]XP_056416820.1 Ig-like V-type domain-containing protein FAM187A [Hyla sarda]